MASITASVGKNGVNKHSDALTVQKLINQNIGLITPLRPLVEDGKAGPKTIGAIEEFQRRILGLSNPNGRVETNGEILKKLNEKSTMTSLANLDGSCQVTYSHKVPASQQIVSDYAKDVIKLALKKSGMTHAVITSTIRTAREQAAIMYKHATKDLVGQFQLYRAAGDEVLKVFQANKNKEQSVVIELMEKKIESIMKKGIRVSPHCVTLAKYKNLNVFDIGVNSTRAVCGKSFDMDKFTKALIAMKDAGYIKKFIDETRKVNTTWHIEIEPNKKSIE